jgi:D-alanine-D-alanine ligase
MGKVNIALLSGGMSRERPVSLKSGEAVYRALDKDKYRVFRYDPRDDLGLLFKDRDKIDLAFILLHGRYGEDGSLQGLLEQLGIPFVGSGVLSSAMALNKRIAKAIYRETGLRTIKDFTIQKDEAFSVDELLEVLGDATVVKPVSEGSSLGMTICRSREELHKGIEVAFQFDSEIIVEQYTEGREVTCGVIGNRNLEALPLIEIVPNPQYTFFDYEAKYTPGATKEICPAPLSQVQTRTAQSCAIKAHQALLCRVWSRTDMIVQGEDVFMLETNTIPGMTETSLIPLAAKTAGMSMTALLDYLIGLSLESE